MNPATGTGWLVLIAVISYFLGSIATAYIVTRRMIGQDIRRAGSQNVGGMNVYGLIRNKRSGRQAALSLGLVLGGDMAKGALAIYVARWLVPPNVDLTPALTIAAVFAILGHNYPIWFRFRVGGIGFATMLGILLALAPPALGVWGSSMLICIFVADAILSREKEKRGLGLALKTVSRQIPGRLVGLGVALMPVYFLNHSLLLPVLGPTILILIKHAPKIRCLVIKRE